MSQAIRSELISIIVPVYNNEKYLETCIDSILAQSYDPIEVILVDDGSKDGSDVLCDVYAAKDSRVKVIHQENRGASGARMHGLAEATGVYVMFVDSDDWLDTNICADLYRAMQTHHTESAMCGYFRSYPDRMIPRILYPEYTILEGKEIVRKLCGPAGEEIRRPEAMESMNTMAGKLYPTHIVRDIKMLDNSEIGTGEDLVFNLEAFSRIENTVYIPKACYYYRKVVAGSITAAYKPHLNKQWNQLYTYIRCFIAENQYDFMFVQALENRIALNTLGVGLNCMRGNESFLVKAKRLKQVMSDPVRKEALSQLDIRIMPPHWKLFYFCAKKQQALLLGVLLVIINRLKGMV